LLRQLTKALVIGKQTGGGLEENTSGMNSYLLLTNPKVRASIYLYEYWNAVSIKEKATVLYSIILLLYA